MKLSHRTALLGVIAVVAVASTVVGVWAVRSPEARKQRYWHQAEVYLKAGKYPEAVIALENVARVDPLSSQAFLKLGGAYLSLPDPRKALSAFSRATQLNPDLVEAQFHAAELLLVRGRVDEAKARAQFVVQKDPANRQAWLLLAQSYASKRQWDHAVQTLSQLLERDPKAVDGDLLLGDVLIAQGKVQEALSRYQEAVSLAPKDPRAYYGLGVAYRLSKRDDQAIAGFETALSLNPDMVNALGQETAIYWNRRDQARAIARVQDQIQRSPKNAQFHNLLGLMYLAGGDTTNAQQSFAQAINVNHNLPMSYLLLGDAYARGKLYELAAKKFEEALQVDPNNVLAYLELGIVQELQGHFDQAGKYYEKAIELNASYVPALNNLAWYYTENKGDLETAQRYIARAVALAPHDPYVLDTQGWIYYKRGQYGPAIQYLSESAQALKTHPLILYHLGMAYLSEGRKDLAKKELREALALAQDFPGADEARKALLTLQ